MNGHTTVICVIACHLLLLYAVTEVVQTPNCILHIVLVTSTKSLVDIEHLDKSTITGSTIEVIHEAFMLIKMEKLSMLVLSI